MNESGTSRLKIGGPIHPEPLDKDRAAEWLRDLAERATAEDLPALRHFLEAGDEADRARLSAVLDLSSFLNSLILIHPDWLERLFQEDAGARITAVVEELRQLPGTESSETRLMAQLRRLRNEASLLIALRDLFGAADARRTTADLSDLAEAAVGAALRFCLLDLDRTGKIRLPDRDRPEEGAGLFVLAMGKLGGRELNYSSDIDIICFFDSRAPAILDPGEAVDIYSRLVRRLVRMIGERTADGYVFRTDLRLRPDPGAMPLAIPVSTALSYYESSGRNWERTAFVKARTIAGDQAAAANFFSEITPFIWRKYLDFAAISDIKAMKERIDRHRGFEGLAVAGHNVKLGRGGIREIEFFVQTQQIIAGGRSPRLRVRSTEDALHELVEGGWIAKETASELIVAYWFLRRVEHAVQMVADEQTHSLPEDEEGLLRIAKLLGFKDFSAFSAELMRHMEVVDQRFGELFAGDRGPLPEHSRIGRLFGGDEDSRLVDYLTEIGFQRPDDIARVIRAWGVGRYRATRSDAARTQLSRVLPLLLRTFGRARDPDAALAAFDAFLERLPSGLQFFALIAANPKLLELLALVITSAPRLAGTIVARPHVFDALIDPAFYRETPTRALLAERLEAFLHDAEDYEDTLARLRIFASEQQFLVGARLLSGTMQGEGAGAAFSNIADLVIASAFEAVEAMFIERHGRVSGGRMVLLGMGRLGSRELTAGSDVDLMLLYDHDDGAEQSDGDKSLPTSVYYMRLTQRLIAALSSPMGEGVLYEVDFRLRPSGNKGPLATHIDSFRSYQKDQAWTWERMALTRSRPVAGDPGFIDEVKSTIRDILGEPRDESSIRNDIAAMRARIERDKPARGALDLKLRAGGLIDLEFIAQWAILEGRVSLDFIGCPTVEVIAVAERAGVIPSLGLGLSLEMAMQAFTRIIQLMRLGPQGCWRVGELPPGLADRIAETLDLPSQDQIETTTDEIAGSVRQAFLSLLPFPEKPSAD
ncbi:bifunctional [glutamine synthetase] adenylyltransferase/[glutamine synthetase]-adenylyl-L-tyrosine phosphorylase [Consotaella salsifontis]|uniref:Bifunctional glutamine synthetase adenylyltransferase/adenylyl-removing enzyme n=1 Tax=Consotaella salsifontis TaxID=1365950 RepID=A0A1T4SX70_9HYPH|nr:bifunctional [glutamine synthetase] adenylyltransferase/[glutamine synthetase]-adenylyl-L-tyrosine phosphorylase [Consotaella salsifontis]SKA32521.1 glutamate-ammonia-ligase adenylyltransferase [Consotaella salsifontis]